jgi:hydrogenase/urease accessory protein HupE
VRTPVSASLLRLALGIAFLAAAPAVAHEVRPAYLEMKEVAANEYEVLWKVPMRGDLRLALQPEFSVATTDLGPRILRGTGTAGLETWRMRTAEPLRGSTVRIAGLQTTLTDVLVRIAFADGASWTARLTPGAASGTIPRQASAFEVSGVYTRLGIEHILTGIDHLLFVLCLIILTKGGWKLAKTVTAFTVSHSVTLTAATLGWVHIPQRPVEAVIALSIVFVAAEIVHGRQGRIGIAARAPWVVAFTFGLLHGLGFAGGLAEAGLPAGHIPLALLFFSIGVETGHFLFIAAVLAAVALARRVPWNAPRWASLVPPYAIGAVAMFWVIQRVAAF